LARKSTIKKNKKINKEKTSVKYIALPASLPRGLNKEKNGKIYSPSGRHASRTK